ncbi:hypothetical protein KSP39_PZI004218 [Platanthera zijinensis]|uniref:Uncharacterized protein n=1 Tax=Platanthera zijinensis TaxID=2320716 RepID=A0AAP0GDM3_9ASPA
MSLQYAEVEANLEELVMQLKSVKKEKKKVRERFRPSSQYHSDRVGPFRLSGHWPIALVQSRGVANLYSKVEDEDEDDSDNDKDVSEDSDSDEANSSEEEEDDSSEEEASPEKAFFQDESAARKTRLFSHKLATIDQAVLQLLLLLL